MEVVDSETAMTQVKEFLEQEQPFNRHEKLTYSRIARSAFECVKKARADGFSFVQICGAFEKAGLLPRKAHPHSFRQAFNREEKRQKKEGELSKQIKNDIGLEKKTEIAPPKRLPEKAEKETDTPKTSTAIHSAESKQGRTIPDNKAEEEARKQNMAGTTQQGTAYGKLTKHSDGTFDFDWE